MFIGSAFLVFWHWSSLRPHCRLAVDALPAFVACTVGFWAYETGAGPIGAIIVAVILGAVTLAAGRLVFDATRNQVVRMVLALLFATPAALAGYHAVLGLAHLTVPSNIWQHVFAAMGALVIGLTAAVRVAGADRVFCLSRTWKLAEAGQPMREGSTSANRARSSGRRSGTASLRL